MMGWSGYGSCFGDREAGEARNLDLTVDQVRSNMQRWLAIRDNPHIKVGTVTAKGPDSITVDIVTTDNGGLVQRYEVDRHTGFIRPAK